MKNFISTILCVSCFSMTTGEALRFESSSEINSRDTKDFSYHHHHIKKKDSYTIYTIANEGSKIGQDYTGVTNTYFYSTDLSAKEQTANVYNEDIAQRIVLIHRNIKALGKHTKASANFITNTLTELNVAVNRLIVDSSENATLNILNSDYELLQSVVDEFNQGIDQLFHAGDADEETYKAILEAKESLQEFVDNLEIFVTQTNLLVYQSYIGSKTIIESNYKLVSSLRNFIKAYTVATYLTITK